jgi:hypothetical protein
MSRQCDHGSRLALRYAPLDRDDSQMNWEPIRLGRSYNKPLAASERIKARVPNSQGGAWSEVVTVLIRAPSF